MKHLVRTWEEIQGKLPGEENDDSDGTILWELIEVRTFGKYRHQSVAIKLTASQTALVDVALTGHFVPPAQWGRDHATTYAYLASRVLNHEGKPEHRRMRTHVPMNAHLLDMRRAMSRIENHPTRLRDGSTLVNSDDWTCADDIVAAGLMTKHGAANDPAYALTDKGWTVWYAFERHIAEHPRHWSTTFDWGAI